MEQPQRIRLRLPEQDLHHLTLGSTTPRKMQEWVEALPLVNVGESSRLLYQLAQELTRLRADDKTRFALLEIIRPAVLLVEKQLGKHYLGQSVVLPEKGRKVASLAQALHSHLATSYKLVVVDALQKMRDKEHARIATVAVHRALTSMSIILLRCEQLYLPTPKHLWLEMHQLFLLSEGHSIDQVETEDTAFKHVKSSTIRDAYSRVLLLATARPNQLRQNEIELVWDATEEWCGLVDIRGTRDVADIFAFDLQADAPPTYRKLASQHAQDTLRSIDAKQLAGQLRLAAERGQLPERNADFTFPRNFTRELTLHLSQAWGNLTERAFARLAASGPIEICVGLGATHYFLSNGVDFDTQVRGKLAVLHEEKENPFMQSRQNLKVTVADDPWAHAFDGGGYRMSEEAAGLDRISLTNVNQMLDDQARTRDTKIAYESHGCSIVNSSPGGYCLEWTGEMPNHVRAGELSGLKESGATSWSIGVIRWIKQLPGKGAQLGIELLAPKATPCGCRVLKQSGETTEWMRTLLLPELRAIGQEATLVTPSMAFSTGYKVHVVLEGSIRRVALYRQLNATAGFRQFLFRDLDAPDAGTARPGGDDFDSIWSTL